MRKDKLINALLDHYLKNCETPDKAQIEMRDDINHCLSKRVQNDIVLDESKKLRNGLAIARCPQCRSKIILPSFTVETPLSGNDENDPDVWCSDMGHWAGKLSECLNYNTKKEKQ